MQGVRVQEHVAELVFLGKADHRAGVFDGIERDPRRTISDGMDICHNTHPFQLHHQVEQLQGPLVQRDVEVLEIT